MDAKVPNEIPEATTPCYSMELDPYSADPSRLPSDEITKGHWWSWSWKKIWNVILVMQILWMRLIPERFKSKIMK